MFKAKKKILISLGAFTKIETGKKPISSLSSDFPFSKATSPEMRKARLMMKLQIVERNLRAARTYFAWFPESSPGKFVSKNDLPSRKLAERSIAIIRGKLCQFRF